jgi:hypothetical protein
LDQSLLLDNLFRLQMEGRVLSNNPPPLPPSKKERMLSSLSENELLRLIRMSSVSEKDVRLRRLQFLSKASLSKEFLSQELLGARSNDTREHSSIVTQFLGPKIGADFAILALEG